METNNEISALFTLIDDPDEEVFGVVSDKIVGYGKPIIANLEHLWETTPEENIQDRIEVLIHRLHFGDLTQDFREWNDSGHHDLLLGALLVSKFQYPELATAPVLQDVEKLRRNIWLELNNYLTPLEQITIVSSIMYNYFGLKGIETAYDDPNSFLLHKVLESKTGNQVSNGVLYLLLCDLLDIPVKAIQIPKQFILAYIKPAEEEYEDDELLHHAEFFIDPSSGQIFTQKEVENYFKKIAVPPTHSYFKPQSNKQVIQYLLEELGNCFTTDKLFYKQQELDNISSLLDD
jgi:regulator of sirC expression with transglutaminase-like and TPR domain